MSESPSARYRYQRLPPLVAFLWLLAFCALAFALGFLAGSRHDVVIEFRMKTTPRASDGANSSTSLRSALRYSGAERLNTVRDLSARSRLSLARPHEDACRELEPADVQATAAVEAGAHHRAS